jgi:hypothetical protein
MKTLLGLFAFASLAAAQISFIGAGSNISVRTNETLSAKRADGRVFLGVVDRDVMGEGGVVAIPRGATAELIVTNVSRQELPVDLESVVVNGQRFAVAVNPERVHGADGDMWRDGRNAEYVNKGHGRKINRSSVLNFRLEQPLRMGQLDNGYNRDGVHFHYQYRTR